ncbi:unnamed protein product, partial [Candidula unifasciata]
EAGSDASADSSTCDSGKGGSDVEVQNQLCQTKLYGDATLQRKCMPDHRSNLNFVISGQSSAKGKHLRNCFAPENLQNGTSLTGSNIFRGTPSSFWPRPSYSPDSSQFAGHNNNKNISVAGYKQIVADNRPQQHLTLDRSNNNNHSCLEPMRSHKRLVGAISLANQNNQFSSSSNRNNYYTDPPEATPSVPHRLSSISCTEEEASMWDCDTTTSGSYIVDPCELNSEIDSYFFRNMQDIVV